MLLTFSGNHYSVVLGLVIQYLLGEDTFSGRVSPRVIILNSNAGGQLGRAPARPSCPPQPPPTGLMRTHHTPGGYQPHAKDSFFYFLSYTKVGLFISFREFAAVEGVWLVLRGVGKCLSVPTCFGLDMSIRGG